MINALPTTSPHATSGALPPPRQTAGGADERSNPSNFARLLGQAGRGGEAAPEGRNTATPGATPEAGSKTAPDKGAQANPEPTHQAGSPAAARTGAPAANGERRPGLRGNARADARADGNAAAQPAVTDAKRPADISTEADSTRSTQAAAATATDAALAAPPTAAPCIAVPPSAAAQVQQAAALAATSDAGASAATGAGRRAGMAAGSSGAEGTPPAMLQALQTAQAAQASQADPGLPTTSKAAAARFSDALAAAAEPTLGAVEGRVDPQSAAPQLMPTPLQGTAMPAATPAAAEATLAAPPGSAAFAAQLGAQLTTFARNGIEHAQLHLNPAEMGPLTLQIRLDGDSASVHMAAEHPLTRQALEQAMPTLASSLREAGLTLSGGGVFEQPRQGQDAPGADAGNGRPREGQVGAQGGTEATPGGATAAVAAPRRRGVVDLVA